MLKGHLSYLAHYFESVKQRRRHCTYLQKIYSSRKILRMKTTWLVQQKVMHSFSWVRKKIMIDVQVQLKQ